MSLLPSQDRGDAVVVLTWVDTTQRVPKRLDEPGDVGAGEAPRHHGITPTRLDNPLLDLAQDLVEGLHGFPRFAFFHLALAALRPISLRRAGVSDLYLAFAIATARRVLGALPPTTPTPPPVPRRRRPRCAGRG